MDFQSLALTTAIALSVGILLGAVTSRLRNRRLSPEKYEKLARQNRTLIAWLSKSVYVVLGIGLVWTLYFLLIGLADKAETEYAANAATLIVSVVTLFSIMIGYYEFVRGRKG